MRNYYTLLIAGLFVALIGCSDNDSSSSINPKDTNGLFISHNSQDTGVKFTNRVDISMDYNPIINDSGLQGAGVGILNIDGDNFPDVVVLGNQNGIKLYKNKGNFKFEDINQDAILTNTSGWNMGVSIVDIDGDNDDDIYISRYLLANPTQRENLLYINNGNSTFTEKAKVFGLADTGYSVMANFFDYDNDGDLDLYVLNQPPSSIIEKKKLKGIIDYNYTNKLYQNNNDRFSDITKQAGLVNYNYSLSALTHDFNNDGYVDIFLANDFEEPDQFFLNLRNGTFKNIADETFKHLSTFSMGSDLADINNDGHLDIFVADMVAEDNFRQKTNMSGMNPEKFWNLANNGYHFQYMFNALHLNNGNNTFSEIAQMAGIANTDWSWSTLFMDMDLDGYKDLMVTNGLLYEVRNKDFNHWRDMKIDSLKNASQNNVASPEFIFELAMQVPTQKIQNYLYQNNGDLTFKNRSNDWGFTEAGSTQGAAYADFDNDGDLDFFVNHTNAPIEFFESTAADRKVGNYLNIKLKGEGKNTGALNSKIKIKYGDGLTQVNETTPYRGYVSSSQNITQFGLGPHSTIDEVIVDFLNGKQVVLRNVKANQTLTIKSTEGKVVQNKSKSEVATLLKKASTQSQIKHNENSYDDYAKEILIPYKLSSLGPVITEGDVNGDGISDLYVGGAAGESAIVVTGTEDGEFKLADVSIFKSEAASEDGSAHFFDADGDGDQDLYVCSGSNEFEIGDKRFQDKLFINNGSGTFSKGPALPANLTSTHTVASYDIDGDNDLDLFIGGRQVPGRYGASTDSYIYINDGKGRFTESETELLDNFGMVTDAAFANIDGDDNVELIIAGEWMPIQIFEFDTNGKISRQANNLGDSNGLWNTIEVSDLDGDGDLDLIGGNLGLNNKYKASKEKPFKVFVDDFDKNGSNDVYLGYYANDGVCYPVRGRQCSSEQMPFVKKKFETYEAFASASIVDVLADKLVDESIAKEVYTFAHTVFFNDGTGNFEAQSLPMESQRSNVMDILVTNLDGDPENEIFMIGNYYDREVETTRSDSGIGSIININSEGEISVVPSDQMGQHANMDARTIHELKLGSKSVIAVGNNNDVVQFFERN